MTHITMSALLTFKLSAFNVYLPKYQTTAQAVAESGMWLQNELIIHMQVSDFHLHYYL